MRYIHLHGFGSSPGGTKAGYLREAFARLGIDLITPDLNLPAFHDLTITRQIQAVHALCQEGDGETTLIGSSMGALVALHYVERYGGVAQLVLMAPALNLGTTLKARYGPEVLEKWKRDGFIQTLHYAYDKPQTLSYALIEDLDRYDSSTVKNQVETLILQGANDDQCPVGDAERFAKRRENVRIELFDTDHMMHDSMDRVWQVIRGFLSV